MGKPIPGRKSTLGSLRGDKTGKTWIFDRFSRFVAPESVCPRFSDEFFKKMDHQNVKIADFTIKAHFWANPQILNRHIRSLEVRYVNCHKILD